MGQDTSRPKFLKLWYSPTLISNYGNGEIFFSRKIKYKCFKKLLNLKTF